MFEPRYRCGKPLDIQVRKIIKGWEMKERQELVHRCIFVTGVPGVGKSELLHWIAQKYGGVYLDLENTGEARNSDVFTWQQRKVIQNGLGQSPGIICIDHVPQYGDEYINAFYDEVLSPLLDRPYLFFFALRNERKFDIGGMIPRSKSEEITVRGFAPDRIDEWMETFQRGNENSVNCGEYKSAFQRAKEHWPRIVKFVCNDGLRDRVIRENLDYWVERSGYGKQSEQIINLAQALYGTNLNDVQEIQQALAGQSVESSPMTIRIWFRRIGWWQPEMAEHNDAGECPRTSDGGWISIAHGVLDVLHTLSTQEVQS